MKLAEEEAQPLTVEHIRSWSMKRDLVPLDHYRASVYFLKVYRLCEFIPKD